MNKRIYLWSETAPYSAESPDQAQPSVEEFKVEGSKGAIVVCPGGGYTEKVPHEAAPIAEMLNKAGISAYVLDYRVMPCHPLAPLADASRAIRVVRSLGYEKVGIMGFSAGGHLTCIAATLYTAGDPEAADPIERLSSRPDAFVPCYAVVSLTKFVHEGSMKSLLGEELSQNPDFLRRFSAEQNITSDTPPAFIWTTVTDEIVPMQNSLLLSAALAEHQIPHELHVFPQGRHGLAVLNEVPDVQRWVPWCQEWLLKQGFGR